MRNILLYTLLVSFLLGFGNIDVANAKGKKGVAAVVGSEKIMVSELEAIKNDDARLKPLPLEAFYSKLLDMLIERKVITNKAKQAGLEDDPRVKKDLQEAKETILAKYYLEDVAEKSYSKEKLKELYDELISKMPKGQEIKASHILVETKDEASKYIKKLEDGADFAELARQHSNCPSSKKGGDLGYFTKETMVPEFSKVAFDLKVGEYTKEPVKTGFGWHVIKVFDKRDQKPPKLEEIKGKLKAELSNRAQDKEVQRLMKKVDIVRYDLDGNKQD